MGVSGAGDVGEVKRKRGDDPGARGLLREKIEKIEVCTGADVKKPKGKNRFRVESFKNTISVVSPSRVLFPFWY